MLSILLPIYQLDPFPLVKELQQQCIALEFPFEILVFDDSTDANTTIAANINSLPHCIYHFNSKTLGRGGNRNALAQMAKGTMLLFLDGDMWPQSKNFIAHYIALSTNYPVVFGGIAYRETPPEDKHQLRWLFGRSREAYSLNQRNKNPYSTCFTSNLLIAKRILDLYPFDATLTAYGYEDLLFIKTLQQNGIPIHHIDNAAYHDGLEDSDIFLAKTAEAIRHAEKLLSIGKLEINDLRVFIWSQRLKKWGVQPFFAAILKKVAPALQKKLVGPRPKLWVLDVFKLYCLWR
ncbi:glycosyltransferase family 2 protein [Flavobacterium sp.]|uniref:glycosyltransferase family 2 protein n=1 Tax=Flavobacterium sp. TaxID=239 RepID=UPI002609DEEF|nr:glycosyltransferase family 2 protein [Flavobacterium sp.]